MLNFDYHNPTHIVFGRDRLQELDQLVPKTARVLILYGSGSVKKYGTLAKVVAALPGRTLVEFGGIEANPRFPTLMQAVAVVRQEKIDFLLAVGGGSVMDGTKFVALAAKFPGEKPEELLFHGFQYVPQDEALPLGTVVTLPATGSEMNNGAVISYQNGKYPVLSPLVFPKFSILDPTLTFTLPPTQVANGVVDSFIHVIEQYVTYPTGALFQDRTAEGILQSLIEIGRKTIDHPEDYETRANLVWNATMALNGLIGAGVPQDWSIHMIGHELTALFGIDHAKTLAIVLPAMWQRRRAEKGDKLLQYAERVWGIREGDRDQRIDMAIERTRDFFESLGIKTRLSDYGVTADRLEEVIAGLAAKGLTALSERQDLTLDGCRQILMDAL